MIYAGATRRVRWPIEPRGAARERAVREAVIVELHASDGRSGLGEAAPLPGVSRDTLEDAEAAFAELAARLPLSCDAALAFAATLAAPAARFAIETAVMTIAAGPRSLAELLGVTRAPELDCAVVVDTLAEARAAVEAGATVLKVKVRSGFERAKLKTFADLGVPLRLDANQGWTDGEARAHLHSLEGLPVEFVEEPTASTRALLEGARLPLALDEGLIEDDSIDPRLAAVVLKPTLLGLRRAIAIAWTARAAGIPAIVTHCLEGPIGTAACAELALALGGDRAVGLAPHPAIADWAIQVPQLSPTKVRATGLPGLGIAVTLDALIDAAPTLTPSATRGPLVITETLELAHAELPEVTAPRSLIATPELATLAAVYDALERRVPIALHHHRLPDGELERQRAQLERVPEGTAVVLFTSGSTKAARGVALSRAALLAACEANALGWRADDRWLLALSMAHAGGLAVAVRCLAARRPVVLLEGDFSAERAARLIADRRVTIASLVPAQLAALLDDPSWRPPAHLRAILLGGAAAPPTLLAAAAAREVPFFTSYGMTETFGQIATARHAGDPDAPLVALPGVEIYGGTGKHPAPVRVRGPMLATCYLDGTPIAPELVTSDLGYVDDAVHLLGRADDVIITGGENVHPLSVEAIVSQTPGVRSACAFGVPDPRWGQVVAIALSVDATFDLAAAQTRWRAGLPAHARPRRLAIAEHLPALPSGKPDRRATALLPTEPLAYALR